MDDSINNLIHLSHPLVKKYIADLKRENFKLHNKIVKLEINNITLKNRVRAQDKEIKKFKKTNRLGIQLTIGAREGIPSDSNNPSV